MSQPKNIDFIQTQLLSFDPKNPRFYRLNDASSDDAVIEEMLDDESVHDLMLSIGQQGYFPGEPLLVFMDGTNYVVAEGNRRLAAVKLLNGELSAPARKSKSVEDIKNDTANKPIELPCLVYQTREEVLRYIGYRHITGVKEWDSLSKAKYLKELCDEFYQSVSKEELLKNLAREIGSKPHYVGALLTALMLYEKAQETNFYGLRMDENDVEFSYITTSLGYTSITEWLGLEDKKDFDGDDVDEDNLKNLFAWCFVRDQQGRTIIRESRRLKDIAKIVDNDDAVQNLIETGDIDQAYLYTNGQQEALEESMQAASARLRVVWNMLLKLKSFSNEDEESANQMFEMAKKIRAHIRSVREDD
ncbi:ParB/Srx family N-terminal domain-containing protein [Pectobacterium versatile]|uniref:ParB/Srx family N-terminal domain-containing protein n=1 Tax=Pectobacterium versatile TaxID=2488639 RepID=UPI001BB2E860|nr:ParB/Srx family N-terminal domain-containing protein [Pectobacterium versatile]